MVAKHLLFFIHGMGRQDATWHEKGLKALKAAFVEYPTLKTHFSFDNLFEPVPVVYDNEFEDLRKRWRDDVAGVTSALSAGIDSEDIGQSAKIEKQIGDIHSWVGGGGDNFFTTAAMDVLLYRFFKTVRMNVNVQVAHQIVQRVTGEGPGLPSWSVLAHSLGTAVAHNTLNAVYSTSFPGGETLHVHDTRPNVLMMVANVSRVLQLPSVPVFSSRVQPGSVLSGRCCRVYLNARHRLDPFMKPKPFKPDSWPDPVIFNSDQYQHLEPSHFVLDKLLDVHNFDHYLINPRVHVPLFRALLNNEDLISDDEFKKAKERFDAETNTSNSALFRDRLEELQASIPDDWRAFLTILKKLEKEG